MQLQTAGVWLRGLPARLRSAAETTVSNRALRPWASEPPPAELRESAELYAAVDTGPQIVLDDVPATPAPKRTPRPFQRAGELSKQLAPRAAALGRQLAPQAAAFGRQLGPLARRGAAATGQGLRATGRRLADLRPLLRLLGRFLATILAGIGGLTVRVLGALARGSTITGDRIAGALQRNQAVLFALFVRAMWWTALALLFLGGRALVEIHDHAPFVQQALPVFLSGLAMCAFLLIVASPARLRWAAFALGIGHGGLLALVWVVSAIG
jgi:hypothetical protein